jgi:hypothetical protein
MRLAAIHRVGAGYINDQYWLHKMSRDWLHKNLGTPLIEDGVLLSLAGSTPPPMEER